MQVALGCVLLSVLVLATLAFITIGFVIAEGLFHDRKYSLTAWLLRSLRRQPIVNRVRNLSV